MKGRLTFFEGQKIVESPLIPEFTQKVKLSEAVAVSDKFRLEFNNWLGSFFGRDVGSMVIGDTMFIHPNTYNRIVKAIEERGYGTT